MSSAPPDGATPRLSPAELAALVSTLQVELVGLKSRMSEREQQNESLRETILNLTHENELLRRRLYGNKTERGRTSELQLTLGTLLDAEKALQKQLDEAIAKAKNGAADPDAAAQTEKPKSKPKGRRDLSTSDLPRVSIEILDEDLEKTAKRIGFEESLQLMYRRGGFAVLVKRVAKYEIAGKDGPTVLGVETPKTLVSTRAAALVGGRAHPGAEVCAGRAALPARAAPQGPSGRARPRHDVPIRRRSRQHARRNDRSRDVARRHFQWLRDLDRCHFGAGAARQEQRTDAIRPARKATSSPPSSTAITCCSSTLKSTLRIL